jgi:GTPase SAR1 family protein
MKEFNLNEQSTFLNLWDTNGTERFHKAVPSNLYKKSSGFFIICSYDNKTSLQNVKLWYDFIKSVINDDGKMTPTILLVNKCEIKERKFTKSDVYALCEDLNIPFIEVSAKNNYNIKSSFQKLLGISNGGRTSFRQSFSLQNERTSVRILSKKEIRQDKKKGCC